MASSTVKVGHRPVPTAPLLPHGLTPRSLRAFFALAFGLGWGLVAMLILFRDQVEAIFGQIGYTNPLFILAVYSPAIAGIGLVWRHYGARGVGSVLRRVTLWRMPAAWWVLLIVGIPAVKYVGAAINGTIGDFPFAPWYGVFPALGIALLIGPVEELGWRGVALPLLQRRWAPLHRFCSCRRPRRLLRQIVLHHGECRRGRTRACVHPRVT
jgi:membrane protease YdiL (CAAX protease family)